MVFSVVLVLELSEYIEIKDPTWLQHFLGLHVRRALIQEEQIWYRVLIFEQEAYAKKLYLAFCEGYGGVPKLYLTPCLGQKQAELEFVNAGLEVTKPGDFQGTARTHLGGLLFLVRGTRSDMMQSVCSLACKAASWDVACDRRLVRIFGYMRGTLDYGMAMLAAPDADVDLLYEDVHSDSDHGGCIDTSRSTSGGHIQISSEDEAVKIPIAWMSKRQSAVAPSTTDAEVGAANDLLRRHALSIQGLMARMLKRRVQLRHGVDNDAANVIMESGASKAPRYMPKHKRISFHFFKELFDPRSDQDAECNRVDTNDNRADVFTKPLDNEAFLRHRKNIGIRCLKDFAGKWVTPTPMAAIIKLAKARMAALVPDADKSKKSLEADEKQGWKRCMCARRATGVMEDPKVRRVLFRAVAYGVRKSNPELATMIDEALCDQSSTGATSSTDLRREVPSDANALTIRRPDVHDI